LGNVRLRPRRGERGKKNQAFRGVAGKKKWEKKKRNIVQQGGGRTKGKVRKRKTTDPTLKGKGGWLGKQVKNKKMTG